jgi:hypothetical protein
MVQATAVIYVAHRSYLCRGGPSAELERGTPTANLYVVGHAGDASDGSVAALAPVEAARRLGVTRSRIYALVQQGELDDVGGQTLRVTLDSVERRLAANAPVGELIKPLGAWTILALASSDAAFALTSARGFLAGSSPGPGSGSRIAASSTPIFLLRAVSHRRRRAVLTPRTGVAGASLVVAGLWLRRSARTLAVHKRRPDALRVPNAFHITSRLGLVHGEDIATISIAERRDPIVRDAVNVYRDVI